MSKRLEGAVNKAKQKAAEALKAKQAQLKADVIETFSSAAGRNTLRWIMDLCSYQRSSVVADPASTEIMINSTVYNEARRNLYLTVRQPLPPRILAAVENGINLDDGELLT